METRTREAKKKNTHTHKKKKPNASLPTARRGSKSYLRIHSLCRFIQCDEWGKAWLKPCAPSTEWSEEYYTCIKTGSAPVTCSASDTYLADPCDHHYYYRCVHQQATRVRCCLLYTSDAADE